MTFTKNNTIKITLKDNSTIFARVTRYNELTGKVCWIDRDGKWKGSTHVRNVVVATPAEMATWASAKAAKVAPLDPCMVGWELGKTKRGPMMMEGYYYSISVYKNSIKVGNIVDMGDGGMIHTQFKDHNIDKLFNEACETWAKSNGADSKYLEAASEFWAWWDEARPNGISAKDFFKKKSDEMKEWLASVKPVHSGNLDLVNGTI